MDPLTDLLSGPRARGAFTLRAQLEPPWGLDVRDDAALTVIAVVTGSARLRHDGSDEPVAAGDVLVVPGHGPYAVADGAGSAPTIRVLPRNRCVDLAGRPVHESMSHGLRRWGNDAGGADVLLIGVYDSVGEVGRMLTDALPPWLALRGDPHVRGVVDLIAREMDLDAPGQGSVLDRLLDVLLVSTVRGWVDGLAHPEPSWLVATDPVVARALDLLHEDAARGWTTSTLARAAGTSRATLGRRFAAQVGEPPMGYLTRLRLARAADLLGDPEVTLATAARRVGYATPFALSAAFKRHFGASPLQYRNRTA